MAKRPRENAEEVEIRSLADLHDWLAAHHARTEGVWLVHHKKASPHYVPMGDIVDECLCWGWVDSLSRGKDDTRTMHWIAPRDGKSNWSRVNKGKIARLDAAGRLQPPGRAMVTLARQAGTWTALDDVENLVIPPDLQTAFDATPGAEANWQAFPRSVKRGALEILFNTKRPDTRAAKIDTIVGDSAENRRPFQWRPKGDIG